MIPAPIRKQIGENLVRTMLAVPVDRTKTRDENARRVLQALMPYLKKPAAHSLTKMHVSALFKFREAVRHYGRNRIHIRQEMYDVKGECPFRLTYDELNNWTKLRYFALAVHADRDATRSGYWTMTKLAGSFLRGEEKVAKQVYTYNSHPVAHSDETVNILEYRQQLPSFESYYDFAPRTSSAPETQKLFTVN